MRILGVVLLSLIGLMALWCGGKGDDDPKGHAPIVILSDADFTPDNGVRSGAGTVDDPYVISGWRIDAKQSEHCVRVEDTTSIFRIERCVLSCAGGYAVRFVGVERAEIVESCISESLFGILWESCVQCLMRDCSFDQIGWEAVALVASGGCQVTGCLFVEGAPAIVLREGAKGNKLVGNVFLSGCGRGIQLEAGSGGNRIALNDFHGVYCWSDSYNRWNDLEGNGNYWSRYRGEDRDGDGVGDTQYMLPGGTHEYDQLPAMVPFHGGAETEWDLCGPSE